VGEIKSLWFALDTATKAPMGGAQNVVRRLAAAARTAASVSTLSVPLRDPRNATD